ncbi:response regulator [Candidatus Woesearchaeota archaeon]|nr:response regulator [Candidatus Woesearchaeota archaeon]
MKILIADDQYGIPGVMQNSIKRNYSSLGELTFTADPEYLLSHAEEYDAILIDLQWTERDKTSPIADMTGMGLLDKLKDYKGKKIIWSAYPGFEAVPESLARGADHYTRKSISVEDLEKCLTE